jgi:hypothetical protein
LWRDESLRLDELLRRYDAKVTAPPGDDYFVEFGFCASRIHETVIGEMT